MTEIDETECGLLGLEPGTQSIPLSEFYSLIHPEDRDSVQHAVAQSRIPVEPGSGAFELEYRVVRPIDGAVRWLLARGRDVPAERGRPTRTVGVSFDITERKQIEEALRDADKRKNDFLATLAHELRNPLAPIRNAVQILMLKGPPNLELDTARQVIARQTQQLARLVDDLLDIQPHNARQTGAPEGAGRAVEDRTQPSKRAVRSSRRAVTSSPSRCHPNR